LADHVGSGECHERDHPHELLLGERFDVGSVPAARNQSLDRLAAAFFYGRFVM
jgi:hypothetical protein